MRKAAEAGKLPRYGVPEKYRFVEEIPKTSVGKLDKKLIRKMYQ
jgi:fatty-acyl-CoA synthase